MKRRDFITLLGGAAAAWPVAARAQPQQVRRIGVLMHVTQNDLDGRARLGAFVDGLKELGWVEGREIRLDVGARRRGDRVSYRIKRRELFVSFSAPSNGHFLH